MIFVVTFINQSILKQKFLCYTNDICNSIYESQYFNYTVKLFSPYVHKLKKKIGKTVLEVSSL